MNVDNLLPLDSLIYIPLSLLRQRLLIVTATIVERPCKMALEWHVYSSET